MSRLLLLGKLRKKRTTLATLLSKCGTNAHAWLPGASGVSVSGLPTNNYLLSDGSTGFSSTDSVVGLALDGLGSVGAELVTNGGFDSATGWTSFLAAASTASISGGVATITQGGGYAFFAQGVLVENKAYQCTLDVVSITGTASLKNSSAFAYATFTSAGQKTFRFRHSVANGNAYLSADSGTVVFDNISVREITGIHATQATTANKAILRRGTYNFLPCSEDISNQSYWGRTFGGTGTAPVVTAGRTAPDGTATAYRVQANRGAGTTSSDLSLVSSFFATPTNLMNSTWIKSNTGSSQTLRLRIGYATSAVTATTEWTRVNTANLSTLNAFYLGSYGPDLTTANVDVDVWHPQAENNTGTTPSDYTPTTTAAASNPLAGSYFWSFDGSNDSLALGSVPFQMSDDHCVIAGSICNSGASTSTVAHVAGRNTGPRAAEITYAAGGFITASWADDVLLTKTIANGVSTIGVPSVATAIKIGNNKRLRVNGAQVGAVESTAMGVTTLDAGRIGIASWAGNPMNGSIGPVIVIKGTVSDADLLALERLVGQLMGITI